jgi:single-strand DNA-binding protein
MSNDLNSCNFIGNVVRDPELRPVGESSVANFTIAVGWKSKDKEGVEWVNVNAWGKLAEIVAQYALKGTKVFVQGSMKTEKYTDKNGIEKQTTKITADKVQLLSKALPQAQQQSEPQQEENSDIPF